MSQGFAVGYRTEPLRGSQATSRLAAIADTLRGEPGLVFASMSRELADYLAPRRAA